MYQNGCTSTVILMKYLFISQSSSSHPYIIFSRDCKILQKRIRICNKMVKSYPLEASPWFRIADLVWHSLFLAPVHMYQSHWLDQYTCINVTDWSHCIWTPRPARHVHRFSSGNYLLSLILILSIKRKIFCTKNL